MNNPQRPERILILEDDPGVRNLMQRRLQRAGYEVMTASDTPEALDILQRSEIDLLLLDQSLPAGHTGLDFHLHLKEQGYDVPVIIVTGFAEEALVIQALRAGVRDFVTKSVEYLDYLPEAVAQVLRQVRTERQLREQAILLEKANDAIIVCDMQERIVYWNRGAEHVYGWKEAEALGQSVERLLFAGPVPELAKAVQHVQEKGEWFGDMRHINRQDEEITVASRWTLVRDELGRPKARLMINSDITQRKKLEAQLLQAQRMESLGMLAGGVAHDFNNLLTIISGYSELLLQTLRPEDASYTLISEIRKAGQRAASLTRQLLAFSRKQVLQPEILDLNALITNLEKMLRRIIGEDIQLATSLDHELGRVKADPAQLEQVIMNLVVNARDAMPTGGKLTIESHNVKLDSVYSRNRIEIQPGHYVLLAVSDTGHGMDEKTKEHIFEPFFTTKPPEKGTGLGLATVYGIVKQSNGHIQVYSELKRGTTFKIYLPRLSTTEELPKSPSSMMLQVPRGDETILLVEDEEHVRSLARTILQTYGYTVLEACDGEEGLQVCQRHPGPIHLLMTDVVMPRMSGRQLADLVIAQRHETKVLFVSGYTDDAIIRHGILEAGVAFLQKPYSTVLLGIKVREVLEAPAKAK